MMAVYWRKQKHKVVGVGKKDGLEFYVLEGMRAVLKSECIPAGKLDIFTQYQGTIPELHPKNTPKPWQELRRFYFRIGTTGINPDTDRIIAIAGVAPGIGDFVADYIDEAETLRQFMGILRKFNPDILIGYYCYKFDLPFLIKRCEIHGIKHPFTLSDKPIRLTNVVVTDEPLEILPINYKAKKRQVSVIDLFPLVIAHDNITAKLENYSLEQVVLGFGLRKTQRLDLSLSAISRLWNIYLKEKIREPLETILHYLSFDIEDTQRLADFLLPQYYYQKILLPDLSLQQLTLTETVTKWNMILKKHYDLEPEPDPQVPVEDTLMVVNPGVYRNCSKINVYSLYPSIILKYGIWTRKDTELFGLSIFQYLTQRLEILKHRAKAGDTEAKLMSGALKIFINSAYRFLGTPGIPFNDYQQFAQVSAYAREIIKFMIRYLEANNAVIVEANNDWIVFSHSQPKVISDALQQELPPGINIELEWTKSAVYCENKEKLH